MVDERSACEVFEQINTEKRKQRKWFYGEYSYTRRKSNKGRVHRVFAQNRLGIGSMLLKLAHQKAGGEKDIIMYTCANKAAIPFYERNGMKFSKDVMELSDHMEWTKFTVGE